MTQLKLIARTESAGTDKLQLQFSDVTGQGDAPVGIMGQSGVNLSGFFPVDFALSLDVGTVYELELTPVA